MRPRDTVHLGELPTDAHLAVAGGEEDLHRSVWRGRERIQDGSGCGIEGEQVGPVQDGRQVVGRLNLGEVATDVDGVTILLDRIDLSIEHPRRPVVGVVAGQLNC